MLFLSIVHHYLLWHYTRAYLEIFHVWLNFLWFIVHFFSIPQLFRSWIAPWKRVVEPRGNKWNLEDLAGYILIGLISRIVGFTLRTILTVLGLVSLGIAVAAGFIVYTFWIAAPLIILTLVVFGCSYLLS